MQSDPFLEIREVLMLGYLRLPVKLGALNIVLGTPSLEDLNHSIEIPDATERGVYIIAHSIRLFRSKTVSLQDDVSALEEMFYSLDRAKFLRLFYYTLRLYKKEQDAFGNLEPFLYTRESRELWSKTKAKRFMGENAFPLPLNNMQTQWVSWNMEEDIRLERKQSWDETMLLASAFNAKGIKNIRDKWYQQDEELDKKRKDILDGYLAGKGVEKTPTSKESAEDRLTREFAMWVAGEMDEHDKIVQSYKDEMMANMNKMLEKQKELAELNRQRAMEEENIKIDKLVGLTDKDLSNMQVGLKKTNTVTLTEGRDGLKNVLDKYLFAKEEAGTLEVKGGELMAKEVKNNTTSLMDAVLRRPKPTLED
jgi:hypothetical protein